MSSQVLPTNAEAAILTRVFQADEKELTPEIARYLLSMKLPISDEQRVEDLSATERAGSLTVYETQELDSYLHIGFLLGTMQSKARRLLNTDSDRTH